jgi:hypothetical protein
LLSEETEDLGKVQSLGARFAHGEISLGEAAATACRACASPGAGASFWERRLRAKCWVKPSE